MDQAYPLTSPHQGLRLDDEGYFEATPMDVEGADVNPYEAIPESIEIDQYESPDLQQAKLMHHLISQPTEIRAVVARQLMATLPTSMLASLIREAEGRLHFDPVKHFPPEITTYLFRYLDSHDLVRSALVSPTWRACAYEPSLWRRLFSLEGWTYRPDYMKAFEERVRQQLELYLANYSRTAVDNSTFSRQASTSTQMATSKRLYVKDAALGAWQSDAFDGLNLNTLTLPKHSPIFIKPGSGFVCPILHPANSWDLALGHMALNWRHLYTARRRLEENWQAGKNKIFRIPHEDYDHEKHEECVYTLQFSSKYLVSGSRDRTVRVWNMASRRLMRMLQGHKGSVLCLQFDERHDRDLIISGGSDACVFVWKFSTGQVIKHLKKAHTQAVLNLRFDDRYLVTCSKDSTIKVWSMQKITPIDAAYPATNQSRDASFPDYIIDKAAMASNPHLGLNVSVDQYGHLMTLNGHNAAVNALQMLGDEIVSVSGDRKIIRWKLSTCSLLKTYIGHDKGIACVHYDGRRIVSGSSDESVRMYDPETTAEIARLKGHCDLVRTIQADFGDVPGDDEKYAAQAKAHSEKVLESRRQWGILHPHSLPTRDPYIIGAKLPPGGGGNRWAKIVSGSYDETVIIWKQSKDGVWSPGRVLRHEDAINATVTRRPPPPPGPPGPPGPSYGPHPLDPSIPAMAHYSQQTAQPPPDWRAMAERLGQGTSSSGRPPIQPPLNPLGQPPASSSQGFTATLPTAPPGHASHRMLQPFDPRNHSTHASSSHADAQAGPPSGGYYGRGLVAPHPGPTTPPLAQAPSTVPPAPQPIGRTLARTHTHTHTLARRHHHHRHTHTNPQHPPHQHVLQYQPHLVRHHADDDEEGTSRLFKLQFDSRRIICCSQQPIIVGWDFADGDRELIEASGFFGETG